MTSAIPPNRASHSETEHRQWLEEQKHVWETRTRDYQKLDWIKKDDFMASMIQFCEPAPNWRALDVGSGPGIVAASVRPHVGEVIGIDLTPAMVETARTKYADVPALDFTIGNVESLEFPDNSFDLVTARMVFHHVDDCLQGLREVLRVLRPNGRLVLCEGVPPDHLTRARYEEIFALKEKRHTFSEAELINLFDEAGFSDILLKPFFMRRNSLNNWLQNGAVSDEAFREIRRLHVEADDHFKRVYRLIEEGGDVFMDWKFVFLRGIKRAG